MTNVQYIMPLLPSLVYYINAPPSVTCNAEPVVSSFTGRDSF